MGLISGVKSHRLFSVAAGALFLAQATVASAGPVDGRLYHPETTGTNQTFAIGLKSTMKPAVVNRDIVVLVDTSASQMGDHRELGLTVLDSVLKSLSANDNVQIVAVDVAFEDLTTGFAPANSKQVQAGVDALESRIPLGVTNLLPALNHAAELLKDSQQGAICYIGDGMSRGGVISEEKMTTLVHELQNQKIAVHSFGVGPMIEFQTLGVLANFTGGVVKFDSEELSTEQAVAAGAELARAMKQQIEYPSQLNCDTAMVLPAEALPVRADRETIYLAKGALPRQLTLADGTRVDLKGDEQVENVLESSWQSAQQSGGIKVAFAGEELLELQEKAILTQVDRLGEQAERALDLNDHRTAGELSRTMAQLNPGNRHAQLLRTDSRKFEFLNVAQNENGDIDLFAPPADAEVPPADVPPADVPPVELPPANVPPANVPPANVPPANVPPANVPPADAVTEPLPPVDGEIAPEDELAPRFGGQDLDLLSEQERMIRIKEQRYAREVELLIEEANEKLLLDPNSVISEIKRAIAHISAVPDIGPTVRDELIRVLKSKLAQAQNRVEVAELLMIQLENERSQLEARERAVDQLIRDEEELEAWIDRIRGLLSDAVRGNDYAFEEAQAVATKALMARPRNGAATAARIQTEALTQLNLVYRLNELRRDRWLAALEEVERSHVPFPDEPPIAYPAPEIWQALTRNRAKWKQVSIFKQTPREQKIREELDRVYDLDAAGLSLQDALNQIAEQGDFIVNVHSSVRDTLGDLDSVEVTQNYSGIKLRSIFRLLLNEQELTYAIKDEVLWILTEDEAQNNTDFLQMKIYPVTDLVIPIQNVGGGQGGGINGTQNGGLGGAGGFGGGLGGGVGGGNSQFRSVPDLQNPHLDGLKKKALNP